MTIFQLLLSAAAIALAARWLTHACDRIARMTRLGHLFVGSIFLAASTSAPELFVDVEATIQKLPNLAAGDLLGSSLVNLTIFAGLFLIFRKRVSGESYAAARPLFLLAALLTTEVGLLILWRPTEHMVGLHWGSFVLLTTYLAGIRFVYKRQAMTLPPQAAAPLPRQLLRSASQFLLATAVIFFASPFLVSAAEDIGKATNLGNTFIGTTLLAFTTSLPELVSSIVAARAGVFRMALGNIAGSNTFNMAIFVLMDAVSKEGSVWGRISSLHAVSAGVAILSMLLLGLFWRTFEQDSGRRRTAIAIIILLLNFLGFVGLYFLKNHLE